MRSNSLSFWFSFRTGICIKLSKKKQGLMHESKNDPSQRCNVEHFWQYMLATLWSLKCRSIFLALRAVTLPIFRVATINTRVSDIRRRTLKETFITSINVCINGELLFFESKKFTPNFTAYTTKNITQGRREINIIMNEESKIFCLQRYHWRKISSRYFESVGRLFSSTIFSRVGHLSCWKFIQIRRRMMWGILFLE